MAQRQGPPPWRTVAADLRRRIKSGEWPAGAPLPTLDALAEEYEVSRSTARKAVVSLQEAGLVESYRGWGTFVFRRE
jgi:DNA-binding GntR family transcriptional regulator